MEATKRIAMPALAALVLAAVPAAATAETLGELMERSEAECDRTVRHLSGRFVYQNCEVEPDGRVAIRVRNRWFQFSIADVDVGVGRRPGEYGFSIRFKCKVGANCVHRTEFGRDPGEPARGPWAWLNVADYAYTDEPAASVVEEVTELARSFVRFRALVLADTASQ